MELGDVGASARCRWRGDRRRIGACEVRAERTRGNDERVSQPGELGPQNVALGFFTHALSAVLRFNDNDNKPSI